MTLLIPIVAFFLNKGNKQLYFKKIILVFFILKLLNEVINNYFYYRFYNVYVLNGILFSYLKMVLICMIFKRISSTTLLRKGSLIGLLIYLVTLTIYLIFFADGNYYDKIPSSFQGILLITLAILFYYEQIKKPETVFIYSLPEFWYVTSVFIHAAGTFFIYIFAKFWLQDVTNENEYNNIHGILTIVYNLMIGFAVWKQYKDPLLKTTTSKPITA